MAPRYSHADARYESALQEMGKRLRAMLAERNWNQADLMRAARLHMPKDPVTGQPARLSADNISNMVNGKRRPTRAFITAVSAALGIDEGAFLPDFIRDPWAGGPVHTPMLAEVRPGVYRVFIDREMSLKHALRVIDALETEEPPTTPPTKIQFLERDHVPQAS